MGRRKGTTSSYNKWVKANKSRIKRYMKEHNMRGKGKFFRAASILYKQEHKRK